MIEQIVNQYFAELVLAVLVSGKVITFGLAKRNGGTVEDMMHNLERKVDAMHVDVKSTRATGEETNEWHAPEDDDGSATKQFMWKDPKSLRAAIIALTPAMERVEAINQKILVAMNGTHEQMKGLREDLRNKGR